MNDRTQAGTADLFGSSTIELIQNRRILQDDLKGLVEPLNQMNGKRYKGAKKHLGYKINAKYYM
jgi:hypothetical protein